MESILKVIDEGIHVIDLDGMTIFYNSIAASLDGMRVQEVIGRHVLDVFPSLTKKTSTLLQVIQSEKAIYNRSQSYVNLHGVKIDTINTTLPIYVNERLIGAVEVAKDYTKLRKLSERLIDLEKAHSTVVNRKKRALGAVYRIEDLITGNQAFKDIIVRGKKAANSSSSILVYGESGTGKELFVQGIHNASPRREQPFIVQNCAALPESLLESIIFGTARGSYTGAVDRPGLFELANKGTLFLDEIQSLSPALQTKLLRVIEDGVVRRVGETKSVGVDVRVIAALNVHPENALKDNLLRLDLFYRLNVLSFQLPPLRERKDDILLLIQHFIQQYNESLSLNIQGVEHQVEQLFLQHQWPGNVRELKHCIEYMMNITETVWLKKRELPVFFQKSSNFLMEQDIPPLREALKKREQELLNKALEQTGGNVLKAAQLLKIPRQTLQYKLKNV